MIDYSMSLQGPEIQGYSENIDRVIQYLEEYSRTWSDDIYNMFLKSFNEFLSQIAPIEYKRPIINLDPLCDILPLWGIRFDKEMVKKLLVKLVETKHFPSVSNIIELKSLLYRFLSELGVENPDDVVGQCNEINDENCLIYLAIITLVLSTNP